VFDVDPEIGVFTFKQFGKRLPEIRPAAPFPHINLPGRPKTTRLFVLHTGKIVKKAGFGACLFACSDDLGGIRHRLVAG
jgi:hypothetical protein